MRALTAAGLGLLLLAGCGGGQAATGSPQLRDLAELERSLWVRTEQLIAECMRAQGFEYQPRQFQAPAADTLTGSPFDLTLTREQAESSGFGIVDQLLDDLAAAGEGPDGPGPPEDPERPDDPADRHAPGPDQDSGDRLAQARDAALLGTGTGEPGCLARAEAAAREELADDIRAVEGGMLRIGELIEADPRYHDLWRRWSRCMADAGIDAPDLTELTRRLARDARELLAPDRPGGAPDAGRADRPVEADQVARIRAREVAAAVAAVDCLEPLRARYAEIVADAERAAGG